MLVMDQETSNKPQSQHQRKHSTQSIHSIFNASAHLSIDPRFIPKSFFKFHKSAGTDDERLAMLDRFRSEGLDPRKLNDSKKLPHVWRWLADAEINCQSLRHQLEKMRIQHEQELQEVESYVGQVWKLSMQRLRTIQQENQHLKRTIRKQSQVKQSKNHKKSFDLNNNNNNNNDVYEQQQQTEPDSDQQEWSMDLVSGDGAGQRHSISSLQASCSLENISFTGGGIRPSTGLLNNRSISYNDLSSIDSNSTIQHGSSGQDQFEQCESCRGMSKQLIRYQRDLSSLKNQLKSSEEQIMVMKKLNRCFEIDNENFAYKLTESETQNNQLEKRILLLEQELRSRRNHSSISANQLESQALVINEQRLLIQELNDKVKHLEELLDSKQTLLENVQWKLSNKQQQQQNSSWFRKPNSLINNESSNNNNGQHWLAPKTTTTIATSDYGSNSSDGFEEIKL